MPIGDRLAQLRKKKGYSMQEMAKRLGIAKSTYAGYESNYREPSLEMVKKMAGIFDVSADFLLGRTDDSKDDDTKEARPSLIQARLRAARKARGLSQEELAKFVNTTKGTISNYENGYSTPSNEMLLRLADVLNTTTDYLLGRTDDPSRPDDLDIPYDPNDPYWKKAIEIYEELQKGKRPVVHGLDILTILSLPEEEQRQFIKALKRIVESLEQNLESNGSIDQ